MMFKIAVFVWLSGLTLLTYLSLRAYDRADDRISNIETSGIRIERWKCSSTSRQNVTIVTENSGAFQARMDACVEWRPK